MITSKVLKAQAHPSSQSEQFHFSPMARNLRIAAVAIVIFAALIIWGIDQRLPWNSFEEYNSQVRKLGLVTGVASAIAITLMFSPALGYLELLSVPGKRSVFQRVCNATLNFALAVLGSVWAVSLLLVLLTLRQNDLLLKAALSAPLDATAFILGCIAFSLVTTVSFRKLHTVAVTIANSAVCLLVGLYSATFTSLWALGIIHDFTNEILTLPAVLLRLCIALLALVGAIAFAAKVIDAYQKAAAIGYLYFIATASAFAVGIASTYVPTYANEVVCEPTHDPNINVCVLSVQHAALKPSIDQANQVIDVLNSPTSEKVVFTPRYGLTSNLGEEVMLQTNDHWVNTGTAVLGRYVKTDTCDTEARPESAHLNNVLYSYLFDQAGLESRVSVARDQSGRIVHGGDGETSHTERRYDQFDSMPVAEVMSVVNEHPQAFRDCTAEWSWFGVQP